MEDHQDRRGGCAVLTRVLVAGLLGLACLCVAPAGPAIADDCTIDGLVYQCTQTTPGQPGNGGSPGDPGGQGGPAQATCHLVGQATWCNGTRACYTSPTLPPVALPKGPKPQPDSTALTDWCYSPDGSSVSPVRTYWSDNGRPKVPPLADQARTAIGRLDLALPALQTSPSQRTLVHVPTWFWIEGAPATQTGSSAFGLVAVATAHGLHVDTGDGGSLDCPWTTSAAAAEQDCSYTYSHSSWDGSATEDGRPAYEVQARTTWSLRFEVNGTPVTIPGVPTSIDGPASTALLRVDEVQTRVTQAN